MLLLDVPDGALPACLAFSGDGARLTVGCEGGEVFVWDLAARAVATRHHTGGQPAEAVFDTPAGLHVLTGRRLLHAAPGSARWEEVGPPGRPYVAAVPSDGWRAVCVLRDPPDFGLFALPAFRALWTHPDSHQGPAPPPNALKCSPDGAALALSEGGHVAVFDLPSGRPLGRVFSGSHGIDALAVAPGGKAVACLAGQFLHFHRFRPTPDSNHHRLNERPYLGVAWHPSGAFFATTKGDGNVDLWDGVTGERRQSFGWGVGQLTAVTFDASGDRAAACSDDGHIVIWDIDG